MTLSQFENELTIHEHTQAGTLDEFHRAYEAEVDDIRPISGDSPSPDRRRRGRDRRDIHRHESGRHGPGPREFAAGDETHVDEAVAAASDAFDEWKETSWGGARRDISRRRGRHPGPQTRDHSVDGLRKCKTRNEAIAEVDEAIDFLRYYSSELERNEGYTADTHEPTPGQRCVSDLQPYGVFGVVAPFNFPFAITVGMTTGALITGNTAVVKPASTTPLTAHAFYDARGGGHSGRRRQPGHGWRAGGRSTDDRTRGRRRIRVYGLSRGRTRDPADLRRAGQTRASRRGARRKNPVIVSDSADVSKAVSGVKFGAFSFSGQKCSATSRVYVHEDIADEFTEQLVEETNDLSIGKPENRETVVSPLIDDSAIERYDDICETAAADGTVLTGGSRIDRENLPTGRYVEPTVVTDIPHDHALATDEHFLPFVTIHPVSSLEEGITKANDSDYGLCAGLFLRGRGRDRHVVRPDRVRDVLREPRAERDDRCARRGPTVRRLEVPGTTGKFAGGPWYLQQFMRQQSRTVVGDVGQP